MKKILLSALVLAALSGCTNDLFEEVVVSEPQQSEVTVHQIPVEVNLGLVDQSRVFNDNLEWGWQDTDVVYGSQISAIANIINPLTLNENAQFANPEFEVVNTITSANYLFAYPTLTSVKKSLLGQEVDDGGKYEVTAIQNGKWTPVMYGVSTDKLSVNDLKNGSSAPLTKMEQLSSAVEVRVWEVGGKDTKERLNVCKAKLSSSTDFLGKWLLSAKFSWMGAYQGFNTPSVTKSGKEVVLDNLDDNTVVFNIAPGTYSFVLSLDAPNGEGVTLPISSKNYKAGKRTVINVEWKRAVSIDNITSWYEDYRVNNQTTLEPGYIYLQGLKWEGDVEPTIYVDGEPAVVEDGRIKVSSGMHQVYAAISYCRTKIYDVFVADKPTISDLLVYTSYNDSKGNIIKSNEINGRSIFVKDVEVSDPVVIDSLKTNISYWRDTFLPDNIDKLTARKAEAPFVDGVAQIDVDAYKYGVDVEVVLNNGYSCGNVSTKVVVSGVPCEANFIENSYDGWNWFSPASLLGKPTVTVGEVRNAYIGEAFNCLILEPQITNVLLMNTEHSVVITSPNIYVPDTLDVTAAIVSHSNNSDMTFDVPFGEGEAQEIAVIEDKEAYRHTYLDSPDSALGQLIGSFLPKMTDTYIEGNYSLLPLKDTEYKYYPATITMKSGATKERKVFFGRYFKYYKQYINKIKVEYAE